MTESEAARVVLKRRKPRSSSMSSEGGTYALVLICRKTSALRIGRLGPIALQPGFYVYVGSAFGPGGLSARIGHHRRISTQPHWHIDYLRAVCGLTGVWFTVAARRREHSWAGAMSRMPGAGMPLPGFGSSDCACQTHLFWFKQRPSIRTFRRIAKIEVNVHP